MNDQTVDLTRTLESGNSNEMPDEERVIRALEKFDVNFGEIRREVNIKNFKILEAQEKDMNPIFAEYESVSYMILFTTYNVEFLIRLLTFHSVNQSQILKLDIQPSEINKEMEYCCNSLQRRRNLNLMFKVLITFARYIESRRLICDLVLKPNQNIKIEQNQDGGIIVVYSDEKRNVKLGVFWSIACSSNHEITDIVEVYYKLLELANKISIKNKLDMLTEPCLDFTKKYHLWKSLIDDLSGRTLLVVIDKMPGTYRGSEEPSKKSLVVLIDKMPTLSASTSKSQKHMETGAAAVTILSDCEDETQKILPLNSKKPSKKSNVVVGKMTTSSAGTSNFQKHTETEAVTILSDCDDDTQKVISLDSEKPSKELPVVIDKTSTSSSGTSNSQGHTETESEAVVILSDHEDDTQKVLSLDSEETSKKSLVVDKMSAFSEGTSNSQKHTETEAVTILSDCENDNEKKMKQLFKSASCGKDSTEMVESSSDTENLTAKTSLVTKSSTEQLVKNTSDTKSPTVPLAKTSLSADNSTEQSTKTALGTEKHSEQLGEAALDSERPTESSDETASDTENLPAQSTSSTENSTTNLALFSYLRLGRSGLNKAKQHSSSRGNSQEISNHKDKLDNRRRYLRNTSNSEKSKSKGVELEDTDSSDSEEIVLKQWPRRKNYKNKTMTSSNSTSSKDRQTVEIDTDSPEEVFSGSDSSAVRSEGLERNSTDSGDEVKRRGNTKFKSAVNNKHRKRKKPKSLGTFRKSPRLSPTNYMQDNNNLLTPEARSYIRKLSEPGPSSRVRPYLLRTPPIYPHLNSANYNPARNHYSLIPRTPQNALSAGLITNPQQYLSLNVGTQTAPTNNGLVLISDNTSFIRSVVPNNLLNVITPGMGFALSRPPQNVCVRLVPDVPVNDSPSFLELNLVPPLKKPKILDDDLEITSVTYIVPD